MTPTLETLAKAGYLSPFDVQLARTLGRIGGEDRAEVLVAVALLSRAVAAGHVCVDLPRQARAPVAAPDGTVLPVGWPPAAAWLDALRSSPLCASADGAAERPTPLVADERGRLYLRRYWEHERRLVAAIEARLEPGPAPAPPAAFAAALDRLFPRGADTPSPDRQRWAAAVAALRRFSVISGGPGTGKTYTVVKVLALLVEQALERGERPPRVALMAPTGKAAARLRESIEKARTKLPCAPEVVAAIPVEASTIHRALGASADGRSFRYHAGNPLPADVVLVDEASMVDLALMSRLFDAVAADTRIVLLGDKDQLASVEAGAVLGDICNAGHPLAYSPGFARQLAELTGDRVPAAADATGAGGIRDCIVELTHSYRYAADRGIGALARAIRAGAVDTAQAVLAEAGDVRLEAPPPEVGLGAALREAVRAGYAPALRAADDAARLEAFGAFRVLAAHREGPASIVTLNAAIEAELESLGLILRDEPLYVGRPVLVTRNDYEVRLFNGDLGVVCAEGGEGERQVVFAAGDGSLRKVSPARLPPHETVFAMTVHKSQGSEFDEVAVVLPPRPSPVVTRELLYTAVTRARRRVTVHAAPEVLAEAIRRRVERRSGLRDALWRA